MLRRLREIGHQHGRIELGRAGGVLQVGVVRALVGVGHVRGILDDHVVEAGPLHAPARGRRTGRASSSARRRCPASRRASSWGRSPATGTRRDGMVVSPRSRCPPSPHHGTAVGVEQPDIELLQRGLQRTIDAVRAGIANASPPACRIDRHILRPDLRAALAHRGAARRRGPAGRACFAAAASRRRSRDRCRRSVASAPIGRIRV